MYRDDGLQPMPQVHSGKRIFPLVHLRNGQYGLIEIKPGGDSLIKEGAETLNDLKTLLSMRDVESEIDIEQKISLI